MDNSNDNKLVIVEPPSKTRSPMRVASELLSMIRREYRFTIFSLTDLFRCDRQWVEDFIVPNVRHIKIQHFFMTYIFDNYEGSITEEEISMMKRGHYFMSDLDLAQFFAGSAKAYRKSIMQPVSALLKRPSLSGALDEEYQVHRKATRTKQEKQRHLDRMKELLTEEGYILYSDSSDAASFKWKETTLPPLFDAAPRFTTPALYAAAHQMSHNTARSKLGAAGAVKIIFGGKTLWIETPQPLEWSIPIQYE